MSHDSDPVRPPAPKRSGRPLLMLVAGFATLLLAVCVGMSYTASRRHRQAAAEADRLDPGWRFDDIEAQRGSIPAPENAALVVLTLARALPRGWGNQEFIDLFSGQPPHVRLDRQQSEALVKELQRAAVAPDQVAALANMPRGRYPVAWTAPVILTRVLCHHVREVAALLRSQAMLQAEQDDLEGAIISCRALLNTSRSIGDEPLLVSQLVRLAERNATLDALERTLAQGEVSAPRLAELQRLLLQDEREPLLLYGVRGERASLDEVLEALDNGTVSWSLVADGVPSPSEWVARRSPGVLMGERADLLRHMNQVVEVVRLAPEKWPQAYEQVKQSFPVVSRVRAGRFGLAMDRLIASHQSGLARTRCAVVALACERYRQERGTWPASLADLRAGGQLGELPRDPFTGRALGYRRREDGWTVYAVGPDLQDNEGDFRRGWRAPNSFDIGFCLWDVSQRRLLALPPGAPLPPIEVGLAPAANEIPEGPRP